LLCQKNQIANVIIKYNDVHTGAKTQSGGLKFDLTNPEYQGSLKFIVTNPPTNDAEYVIIKNKVKEINLFFNIKVLYISVL
tara:strand:- start:2502 stop:2744 length:243 start_codon:yes stop_codon:yes gene_type:complete